MTSRDESLRALADWCSDRQVHWAAQGGDYAQGRVNAFCEAEYEIRERLAALLSDRQEVAPVADERLCDFFADVGEVEKFMDDLCNVVTELTGDEGEDDPITVLRRYIASTGQTSDARDVMAARIVAKYRLQPGWASLNDRAQMDKARGFVDAAMRQEAE